MTCFTESVVEDATLDILGGLGYAILHGPDIAPGEPAAERTDYGDVVLMGRLRAAADEMDAANGAAGCACATMVYSKASSSIIWAALWPNV